MSGTWCNVSPHTLYNPPLQSGHPSSRIWLIGEAPGGDEIAAGQPFVGASGRELTRLLLEAGINRADCFITNICHDRPPANEIDSFFLSPSEAKKQHVPLVNGRYPLTPILQGLAHLNSLLVTNPPTLIIAFGNTALWGLTGLSGIGKWRGSILTTSAGVKVIPTWHPAAILREWSLRRVALQDLRRARAESSFPEVRQPQWNFNATPTALEAEAFLENLLVRLNTEPRIPLAVDIETRARHIACVGIAWSKTEAICFPFMSGRGSYWTAEEEYRLTPLLQIVLTHPSAWCIFQNGAYDLQYFAKEWGFLPRMRDDTMLMQHVAFPGMKKGLDFLSSLYCSFHRYWKDDGKEWDPELGEESLWRYNCEDCIRTFEVWEVLQKVLASCSLTPQYRFQIDRLAPQVIRMMLRGIKVDPRFRQQTREELEAYITSCESWFVEVLTHPLNVNSTPAMRSLFFTDFGLTPTINRKTHQPSLDDSAMDKLERRNPLLAPLFHTIRGMRSARTILANVLTKPLSPDGRARSTINLAGAETFRFSSSEDAFGFGYNMQNITKGNEEKESERTTLRMPNIRRQFIPDMDNVLFEVDLKGADARVVAWEADDAPLKAAFRSGVDIHAFNAESIWRLGLPLDAYKKDERYKPRRHRAKTACHAVNYGCKARTLAEHIQTSTREAEEFIALWFRAHPAIASWHRRIDAQLQRTSSVTNKFGYRRYYFDRLDGLLPEALAWIGQSTTAIAVNHVLVQVGEQVPEAQLLLQTHDSITFQIPRPLLTDPLRERLRQAFRIIVPYDDPLEMPYSVATSDLSWGDVVEGEW